MYRNNVYENEHNQYNSNIKKYKKIMKKLFTTLLFFMISIGFAFSQSEQVIVKSIPLQNASGIVLELPGEVKAQEWERDYIRVTVTINALNTNEDILKRLITVGRYDIQSEVIGDEVQITMPKMEQQVTIKGTDLQDRLLFEVSYPKKSVLRIIFPTFYISAQSL